MRELVQEIVEGDFDQMDLYAAKLAELEGFIAEQTRGRVEQTGAATLLDGKESELRHPAALHAAAAGGALAPLAMPDYLRDFLAQVTKVSRSALSRAASTRTSRLSRILAWERSARAFTLRADRRG